MAVALPIEEDTEEDIALLVSLAAVFTLYMDGMIDGVRSRLTDGILDTFCDFLLDLNVGPLVSDPLSII